MGKAFKKGDHVAWDTPQGETHGTVERKLTGRTHVKGHQVAASPDEPQYLVRSDTSGKEAAHRPEELRKRSRGG
jgi:hypothetical protein